MPVPNTFVNDTVADADQVNDNFAWIEAQLLQGGFVGMMVVWPGLTVPSTWLYCDDAGGGRYISPAAYPELFAVIGFRFGQSGEGEQIARLPNPPAVVAGTRWIIKAKP